MCKSIKRSIILRILFFTQPLTLYPLVPRFSELKNGMSLSDSEFGFAMTIIPVGSMLGFAIGPQITKNLGSFKASFTVLFYLTLIYVLVPLSISLMTFSFLMFLSGIGSAFAEVALNAAVSGEEKRKNIRLISQCHGFWSLGSVIGIALGGIFAEAKYSILYQSTSISVIIIILLMFLLAYGEQTSSCKSGKSNGKIAAVQVMKISLPLPSLYLVPICIVPLGIATIESAVWDWGAILMRDVNSFSPASTSIALFSFSIAMMAVRLVGDKLTAMFGEVTVIAISTFIAASGLIGFSLATSSAFAIFFAIISGAGIALVYPLSLSIASRAPGAPEDNIASLTFIVSLVLLVVPFCIGIVSELTSLRSALMYVSFAALPPLLFLIKMKNQAKSKKV